MSEEQKNTFSKVFEKELERRAWGKKHAAEKIDVSEATIGRWLNGKSLPKPEQRQKLMEVLGMSLPELGLMEEETSQQETILEAITNILQKSDDASIGQKLQTIINYVAGIAAQKTIVPSPVPPLMRIDDTSNVIEPTAVPKEAVTVRTKDKVHTITWIGTRDISIDDVVSIETGNKIASWRYIQSEKEQREPHNFDMKLHVCQGQTVLYTPPVQLTRLHIIPASPNVRCIPTSPL